MTSLVRNQQVSRASPTTRPRLPRPGTPPVTAVRPPTRPATGPVTKPTRLALTAKRSTASGLGDSGRSLLSKRLTSSTTSTHPANSATSWLRSVPSASRTTTERYCRHRPTPSRRSPPSTPTCQQTLRTPSSRTTHSESVSTLPAGGTTTGSARRSAQRKSHHPQHGRYRHRGRTRIRRTHLLYGSGDLSARRRVRYR